jgi:CRP-like cAMP-binding protein
MNEAKSNLKEDPMPDKKLFSKFNFFSDANPDVLANIATKSEVLEFQAGDIVFRYEDPAEHFFGLIEGQIELSLVFKDKILKTDIEYEEIVHASMVDREKQIVVDTVHPGQVFGWSSIVGPPRRTVTAKCKRPCRVCAVPAADLKAMFDADHSFGYIMMKRMSDIISKRLKNRTEKLIETWVEAFDVSKI